MRKLYPTYCRLIATLLLLGCSIALSAQGKTYYVKADSEITTSGSDGLSWENAITLTEALNQAKAGDEIWVKGYEDITGHIYKAPKGGFVLPSGVAMYGGFAGDETIKNDLPTGRHKYQMKYQTALVGDIDTNDKASQQLIIYPENTTRNDNATHVLTLQMGVTQDNTNDGNKPTIVSGFLIAAGNASGENTSANGRGGGIYVVNNSKDGNAQSRFFRISQCNFANNYGMRGGAIYVDNSCTNQQSAISYCSIFNNVAGKRGSSENEGGGMWIDGTATVYNCNINNNTNGGIRLSGTSKIVNCSVIANTVSAADLTTDGASNSNGGGAVYNTVLWHSTALSKQDTRPAFYSCAFPEVEVTDSKANTDANGNVRISNENHGIEPAPWFKQSAVTQGYDFSFSSNLKQLYSTAFTFEETSALLNKGKLEYYKNLVVDANLETASTDIMGRTRYQTSTIDIGAYEYARMKTGRIRYVKPKKEGLGDGSSWDNAMDDIQKAINDLAEQAGTPGEKGEVWVATGIYEVKERIIANDASAPVSLLMKNGISVYGAFEGKEKSRSERIEKAKNLKPWGWQNESIIRGLKFNGRDDAIWNNSDEAWNIKNSESYHVVWFAPLPEGEAFTDEVYLEGFTIEGGKYYDTNAPQYAPGCGAGVYINDPSARMRYCTVRFCNSGMIESGSIKHRGGGIYCKKGQTEGNLVYDCSAYQGGGIYIDEAGFITRSMVTNCSAYQGAGVYLNGDASNPEKAYYQILATSVISNNTSTRNGAVYLDGHGLVINNTIVNNYTNNTSDPADELSSNTGGVYIKEKGLLANNVIWNNSLLQHKSGTSNSASSMAQIYAANPSEETVQFYNNAISDVNAAKWTSTYQSGTISINTYYSGKGFVMGTEAPYNTVEAFDEKRGVLTDMKTVNYYWETLTGSRLRNVGISYALLPSSYLYQPKIDLSGKAISSVPSAGAYMADNHDLVFEKNDSKKRLRIYFDRSRELVAGTGQSWEKSYTSSSVDEVLGYLADIKDGDKVKVVTAGNTTPENFTIEKNRGWEFEICGREGIFEPKIAYTFEETDARSCTFNIQPCVLPITVYGGYPEYSENPNPKDEDRDPIKYRTELNGNLNGSELNKGLYHLVRIEAGANITIDGYAFTHAYAAGTAYMPYGGGVLIGSMDQSSQATTVKLKNCIFENNTATDGGAIATMPDAVNVKLELENCVINNNTSKDPHNPSPSVLPSIIYLNKAQGSNNKLTLNHVSIINNEGVAPDNDLVKRTSYAVGNKLNINGTWDGSKCKNSIDINTLGKNGAMNFSNPTNEVGAKMSGNVYYGGYSSFRPLTSSEQAGAIINSAQESNATTTAKDITGEDRNLGGVPDLGAYEALLPKAGKIIYVRSYNQDYESSSDANKDDKDGNPDFNLLNESDTEYDGSTWDKAIIGNAMCDNTKTRSGNDFYVKQSDNTLLSTTIDNTDYSSQTNGKYRSEIDSYGDFWTNSGNKAADISDSWGTYNKITNNREEQYISGLQYAVERAAELNKIKKDSVVVWVGAGIYTDYKGFVIRDNVKVYGGFPYEGYPTESDRHPLLSQYVPARKEYENLKKAKYETILQIRKESPVYFKNGDKEMWYQEKNPTDGSNYDFTKTLINSGKTERHYVLYQPDVCLPTWSPSGDGNATRTDGNAVRYKEGYLKDNIYYKDYEYAKWDGFSVRHGYIINYPGANRDGGAGVRVFRGVELENLIIVNNFNHGSRVRGGGLYMDGENSKISNSYLLRNLSYANRSESYGGGAYMIQGTGYNLVVANNRCYNGSCRGGGIFLESAKFYNNTIAYNMATNGTGIYHWQDAKTGVASQLSLYNCIIYDNYNNSKQITDQVNSAASGKMKPSHNCYMNSSDDNDKFLESDGNFTGPNLDFPFEDKTYESGKEESFRFRNARLTNNFRLNEADGLAGNKCLNGGTTNVGNGIILPETDMDYTNRIKDCAIDIGAYEADNTTNIAPQEKTNSAGIVDYIYYVTQNGWGNRSGDSPENAACADKLQDVLTAAGKKFETANQGITENTLKHQVFVKVAGYQADETGKRFTYHANTLADPSDPQSYTFLIPNGVCLMGGYYEGDQEEGKPKAETYNWDNDKRDCISTYQTVLSAKTEVKEGSAVNQEVNGYHTVCFGKWPTGDYDDYNTTALTENTIIDGCRLIDGNASDKSGFKSMGGAAIVPRKAHVRNCEISDCQATQGGALTLLKGSIVSGSVIVRNKAQKGGAIYALRSNDKNEDTKNYHAYVISCTIAKNEATIGGGIYQEENSLIGGNSVIWGNSAQTDNNISGDVNYQSYDYLQGLGAYTERFYPYNYCFVEKMALPANKMNTEMTSDLDSYFNDNKIFKPRAYSSLIGNGVEKEYVNAWKKYGISSYDITGKERNMTKQQTAGAYTSDLPEFDNTKLLRRLFVSQTGGEIVTEEEKAKYYGRSFLTPFNSLEAALDYINEAREEGVADETTHFEILMTGGTYKPSKMRQNKDLSQEQNTIDRRLQSFTIPVNVDIFGSFSKDDLYSSTPFVPGTENKTGDELTNFGGKTLVPDGDIKDILANRNKNYMTDNNKNGLIEPWEFQNPTILSGDIKASEKERNVYHVVYSNASSTGASATLNNDVVLDGITIMNGETTTKLKTEEGGTNEVAEIGRGGGIYTNRVNYTLNRCRLIKNSGLHGGAVYVNNASLDIIGSTISGNSNVSEKASQDAVTEPGKGGAIYLYLTKSVNGNLHIVNSLLANNDVTYGKYTGTQNSQGGAIYIRRANDAGSMAADYQDAYIVNSLIVNNKAKQDGAIHVENEVTSGTITPILYNTAIWGNESTGNSVLLKREHMCNCAWDELPASTVSPATDGNIKLNKENIASAGPRFTAPTTTKGYEGYTQDAKWNPQAISVLTDAGDGKKDANDANETGKYQKWWTMHNTRLEKYGYPSEYIRSANSSKEYYRYVGPKDEKGVVREKPIDIGMYEFQYVFKFTDLEKVYIGTEEKGNGDGSSWDNQSTDLRGAIIAMANPSGNKSLGTTINNNRKVFVRGGTYYSPTYSSGDAFSLIVNNDEKAKYITSIELVGGCTGTKNADETEVQDFSKPSVLIENPVKAGETKNLLNIVTNGKPVTISGFTFQNQSGVGVNAKVNNDQAGKGEKMRLHHCAFRKNNGTGMVVNNQKGYGINMWNVLFADGIGDGLTIDGSQSADITNATFVNNTGTAVSVTDNVYNSVAWKNGSQNLNTNNKNVVIASSIENGDVLRGPNFVDPNNGDYRIRPSLMLLDKGSNEKYPLNADINSEKDLGNTARLIGDNIDIGAYECDTKMIQIIYVKEGSAVAGTGESWDNPTNDLQGAINLAELYANKNEGEYGYVFVDRNLKTDNVNISMPGVKMFGSMREEKSSETEPEAIVKDLLTQRKGIIESASLSAINGLTLNNATTGTETRMCLVDGFKVSGNVSLQGNSMLSTSILNANAKVTGDASGWLYNSLALGTVEDVKAVNVTASGELPSTNGSGANRSSVNTYNKYVKDDYWKYQLDETDNANINANTDASKTQECIDMVMHNHDLAGNQRIRDNVDNGCFETWYLTGIEVAVANEADYPHGKSVVYVMEVDKELKLDNTFYTETNPFSPGFLLLKHHAGLRGNNSYVNLTNFAVERNLKSGTNFFSMPFKATNMEVEGTNNPADGSVAAYYYNAATRAKYDYKFDQNESKAWVKGVDNQRNFTAGFRMDAKADKMNATGKMTVRFYGTSYTEKDGSTNKSLLDKITLVQNNNQQPWSDSNGGGLKFTHKENMGWNLFGSPYLCAMNYSDMEYGRVIYQCEENGSYKAINTYDLDTGVSTNGYIPAMDAVFTQTATLDNSESVIVGHSEARATTAYQATRALDIAITQSNRNSRAGNSTPVDDQLQLNAVPAYEAKSDFDMGSDGVKWMTNQNAQIYAMRNGGRYSLLSAVSIDAEQTIGVSLPETGEYSISIPEDCDASEYETVWLKDKETGKAVDLKNGSYPFYAAQTGEMNNRFNISFNRKETDMKSDITIIPSGNYHILIKGLKQNDIIRIYGTSGVLALQKQAKSDTELLCSPVNGTVAVEVMRGGKQIAVKKIALK